MPSAIIEVEIRGVDRFESAIANLNLAIREAVSALSDVRIVAGSNSAGVPMMSRADAEACILRTLRGDEC